MSDLAEIRRDIILAVFAKLSQQGPENRETFREELRNSERSLSNYPDEEIEKIRTFLLDAAARVEAKAYPVMKERRRFDIFTTVGAGLCIAGGVAMTGGAAAIPGALTAVAGAVGAYLSNQESMGCMDEIQEIQLLVQDIREFAMRLGRSS
ncbi:MAG: hypothetical protein AAF677_06525 [Pseudomonadota bacterium]